jgi:SAM-dependent methyltransferase
MTAQGQEAARIWKNDDFARSWAAGDTLVDLLAFPRKLAAALVAHDRPDTSMVVDIASGPGAFLQVLLEQFPAARGVWSDASESMHEQAREALAGFTDRITFTVGDMTDLTGAGIPHGVDVIATSRAAHHLDREGLADFYQQAAQRLAPGGWLINLDHIGPADIWDKRYRAVRPAFNKPGRAEQKHHHNYPLTSINDHMSCLIRAGLTDVDIAWRAMYTCLFMARRDG